MKNNIVLAFGSDKNYLNKQHFQNYLNSIQRNSNFDRNILCYLGTDDLTLEYDKIEIFNVDPASIVKPNCNNCIQHGEFLNSESFDEVKDSDVIVFTDGDMILQRGLSEKEEMFIRNLKDDDVYVGYNASPTQTLSHEAECFREKLNPNWKLNFDKSLDNTKCYNTGVLCMNKKTWRKLKDFYIQQFDLVKSVFKHYAKQQWLISYILGSERFNVFEMGYELHNHDHCGKVAGTTLGQSNLLEYNNSVILFKHRHLQT